MQIGGTIPSEHMRSQPDKNTLMLAEIRMAQRIAIEVIQGTLKATDEMNQVALSTNYEQNFSRVNLLA